MMPLPQMRPRGWRERWMHRFGMNTMVAPMRKGELTIPNWLTGKSLVFFFVAMFACWGAFGNVPGNDLIIVAGMSVILFFAIGLSMSKSLSHAKEKLFLRDVVIIGFAIRFIWVLYCYFFFNPEHYSNTFGATGDVEWYMPFAQDLSQWLAGDSPVSLSKIVDLHMAAIDDVGYPMWLAVIYLLTGNASDVFVPFLIKCIVSAYCAVCMYRVAKRHFGEGSARMAAIFVCLNPNMIYWSASMMKETEMVFVTCLAIDLLDKALSSGSKLTFRTLWPGMLAVLYLFFIRTALGLALLLAIVAHIVMASSRVMSLGKKIIAGVLVVLVMIFSVGDRVMKQSRSMYENVSGGGQKTNMEWRARRAGGNSFAKYAGAAVFAPLIFTLPFPTFNQANVDQIVQVQLSGGSYIKNIFSFFVIIVMIMMLISGEWRRHVFILTYTVGYLAVLVFSGYAQSGRFHMPAIPMLMLIAAYGIQIAKGNVKMRRWFPLVLVLEVVACLAWNWFKLKGRGMI